MKSFYDFINESAPPSDEAEVWIKANKDSFKDQYGDEWESVLYATAWKKFGMNESTGIPFIDSVTKWFNKQVFSSDYKLALTTLIDVINRKKKAKELKHDVVYYANQIARSFRNVDGKELASMYQTALSESDAPSNVSSGVAVADNPFKVGKVAGCDCIEVDSDTYIKCKFGKKPYARWTGYVEDEGLRTFVQKHYSKSKSLMIVNKDTGAASYLRR